MGTQEKYDSMRMADTTSNFFLHLSDFRCVAIKAYAVPYSMDVVFSFEA
jgi:hypothetical protein